MRHVREAFHLLMGLLRELSDENAYQRFLAKRGTQPSKEEWRLFIDGRHAARFRRAKCC
jgi:hypothetical protein